MKIAFIVFLPIITAFLLIVGAGFNTDRAERLVWVILIIDVFGIPWLIVIASPFLILYLRKIKEKYSQEIADSAKWHLNFSWIVIFVVLSKIFGISFSFELGNAIAIIMAFVSLGVLIGFTCELKLRYLGMSVKWLLIIGGVPFVLLFGFGQLFEDLNPKSVDLGDAIFCNRTDYGFVSSDQGATYKIFKRYYFVDRLLSSDTVSYFNDTSSKSEVMKRCDNAFQKARLL